MSSMGAHGIVLAVLAVTVAVAGLPVVLDAGIDASQREYTTSGETFTPVGGEVTVLENSKISRADYDDTVTVRLNDGTVAEPSNYTWYEGNGTIKPEPASDLANDSNASIDYGWNGETKDQSKATDVMLDTVPWLKPLIIIAMAALFLVVLRAMGGL